MATLRRRAVQDESFVSWINWQMEKAIGAGSWAAVKAVLMISAPFFVAPLVLWGVA